MPPDTIFTSSARRFIHNAASQAISCSEHDPSLGNRHSLSVLVSPIHSNAFSPAHVATDNRMSVGNSSVCINKICAKADI
jgi:hypothetical protein